MHKSWETKFYMVAPNLISIITAVFYVKNMIISACTLSRTTRVRLTGNTRILCSDYGLFSCHNSGTKNLKVALRCLEWNMEHEPIPQMWTYSMILRYV